MIARVVRLLNVQAPGTASGSQPPPMRPPNVGALRTSTGMRALVVAIALGLLVVIGYAAQVDSRLQFYSIASVGVMVAGSSLLAGGLLGFLFGIPRTLQQDQPVMTTGGSGQPGQPANQVQAVEYRLNTNLEQISDWLTKILVGIGLTQLSQIPEALQRLSTFIAGGIGNFAGSTIFALATLLYFSISGFLLGFLWTRLYLAGAFRDADRTLEELQQQVAEINKQSDLDARALNLVERQLNPGSEAPAVPRDELIAAIKAASSQAKAYIFTQAHALRTETWDTDKAKMERTIPIFEGLVASDPEKSNHRYRGQLGYALKDQRQPNCGAAEAALTEAIEIRGDARQSGWLFYEFNRAYCRIMQDPAFSAGTASTPELANAIVADLKIAARSAMIRDIINKDADIMKWMQQNNVDPATL